MNFRKSKPDPNQSKGKKLLEKKSKRQIKLMCLEDWCFKEKIFKIKCGRRKANKKNKKQIRLTLKFHGV